MDRGEGTLGKLVNDPALYEGASRIATGAEDSKFTQWMLRRYRKKGVEAEDAAKAATSGATEAPPPPPPPPEAP